MVFGRIPRRKRVQRKRRAGARKPRRAVRKAGVPKQAATLTESYQVSAPDGIVIFNRAVQLSSATFDRAQAVAQAYQEYCIKKVTLVFRPSCDTFTPAAGNSIPNLYYVLDKATSIPTNASLQTLLDMGCRPTRFDSKNIRKSFKPVALLGADTSAAGTIVGAQPSKASPWLATNANAAAPGALWAPSQVEHAGCAFFVTKMSGLTPAINYTIDLQIDFAFRKPTWHVPPGGLEVSSNMNLVGDQITHV